MTRHLGVGSLRFQCWVKLIRVWRVMRPLGHMQFLTNWGLFLATATCLLGALSDLLPGITLLKKSKRGVLLVALPLGITISSIYVCCHFSCGYYVWREKLIWRYGYHGCFAYCCCPSLVVIVDPHPPRPPLHHPRTVHHPLFLLIANLLHNNKQIPRPTGRAIFFIRRPEEPADPALD